MNKKILLLLLCLPLLVACSGDDEEKIAPSLSSNQILLTADVGSTRGLVPLETSTLFTIGVFAGYETESETFSSTSLANDFINNVKYQRSFITDSLAGTDVCYWPFVGKLSFFAYAPYISDTYLKFASDYVSGYPRMSYTPFPDVTNQPDFCIATPVLDQHMTTAPIPLHFTHSLCQILFSANYTGDFPSTTSKLYVKIDSIKVCNVIGRKTVVMSNGTPCFDWQDDSECPASDRTSYFLRRSGLPEEQHISDDSLYRATTPTTDNYRNMSTANGRLYLLPQSMTYGQVYLIVSYGYYEMADGAEVLRASTTTRCNLPAATWLPTYCYRYKFTINLSTSSIVNPTVSVVGWNDVDNTQSNPNHIE